MTVYALVLYVCTTQFAATWGMNPDNYTMSCGWSGRGALYATQALCEADGKQAVSHGAGGTDIAGETRSSTKYRCEAQQVYSK